HARLTVKASSTARSLGTPWRATSAGPEPGSSARAWWSLLAALVERDLDRLEVLAVDVDAVAEQLVRGRDDVVGERPVGRLGGEHRRAVEVRGVEGQVDRAVPVLLVDVADAVLGRPDQLVGLVDLPQLVAGAELRARLDDQLGRRLGVVAGPRPALDGGGDEAGGDVDVLLVVRQALTVGPDGVLQHADADLLVGDDVEVLGLVQLAG